MTDTDCETKRVSQAMSPAQGSGARARRDAALWVPLPHEVAFGLFLVITWFRLVLKAGPFNGWALAFLAYLLGSVAVIAWARQKPTPWRWRVRLLYYPAVMGLSFYTLPYAVSLLGVPGTDALLLSWDRALLGETPSVSLLWAASPWLNDLMMLGYLFFFYYLIAGPAHYCIYDLPRFRACFVGLFSIYSLGFLGYTLFPAGGPHRFMEFATPLAGPWVVRWTLATVNGGSNGMDVFPSIHFAVSFYLLVFDWSHYRRRFWRLLGPCLLMWFSTLYLRYHYFVDLLAGLAIAGVGLLVWRWYELSALARETEDQAAQFAYTTGQDVSRPSAATERQSPMVGG